MAKLTREGVERKCKETREKGKTPDFSHADLSGLDLSEVDLNGVYLTGAKLSKTNLYWADLSEADLGGATLNGAELYKANLSGAELDTTNLSGANLSRANLNVTDLKDADLSDTNLQQANLIGADLRRTILFNTNLSNAIVGNTTFLNIDLSAAKGLDTLNHRAPSSIDIDTIYRSKGMIPEVFLRGVGISDTFIAYVSAITGEAIQYYSCFISYSSLDEDFAQRLHTDLQQNGVRCWFAPEDMKIGVKIRSAIDQSIRIHDKLLVILSESSMQSDWVEDEVETAIEEEKKRQTTVLFPIRLDEAVMDTTQAWAAKLRRTWHIGDFTRWKDHDSYQHAFDRLLRDLKAEG